MSQPPANARRHAVDGTLLIFAAEALIAPVGILTAGFLTRRLGADGYGLFTLAATLVAWLEISTTTIFSRAAIKLVGETEDWWPVASTVVWAHGMAGVVVALVLWLLAQPIAHLLAEPALAPYLRLFALDIPIFCLSHAHRSILIGIGRFRARAVVGAGRWVVRLLLIVALVGSGLSLEGAILGIIGASLAELILCRCYVRPPLFRRSSFPVHQLCSYAAPLFLSAMSMRLFEKVDLVMLKGMGASVEEAGFYAAAQNLSLLPGLFAASLAPLLLSTLSRMLGAGEERPAREMVRDALRAVLALLPLGGLFAGSASEIVALIFGARFLPAAPLASLLLFGALASVIVSVALAVLTASGRPGWTLALSGPLLLLAAGAHVLLIPRFGALGAATVTFVAAALGAAASLAVVSHTWRISPPLATLGRSILLCALAYALAAFWPASGLLLALKLPLVALVTLLGFPALGELSGGEVARARCLIFRPGLRRARPRRI